VPVTARELFAAGKVREAEKWLTAHLREHPADTAQRVFLFELLCFSGDYARAEKQLAVLAGKNAEAETGAIVYYAALHAEKTRHELFEKQTFPTHPAPSPKGELNGKAFTELRDADPDIGSRLEVFALVQTAPSFQGKDLGEVLIPAIYPFSWKNADEAVWLGRVTDWSADDEGREYPSGQKMLLVDGEEVPFLEVRSIEFAQAAVAPSEQ
jgi:type VI secretion system protein ImpE